VPVYIEIEGESLAVKRGDAILAQSLSMVEIRCLPREMPEVIKVDVSELEVHDKVFVRDVETPVGEIVSDPDLLVVAAKPPTVFVEEVAEAEGEEDAEGEAEAGEEGAAGDEEGEKSGGESEPAAN
jgi:large subunit ribosomal protein L25